MEGNVINLRSELISEVPKTTYLTHFIHNFYPAKFIPQVPRFVINYFSLKDCIILDPFAGSGTTAVESLITGNSNISNDINPLTRFLINLKTLRLNPKKYFDYISRLDDHFKGILYSQSSFQPKWKNLNYWYPAPILESLSKIWGYLHQADLQEMDLILKAAGLFVARKYSFGDDRVPKLFKSKHKILQMNKLLAEFLKSDGKILFNDFYNKAREYLDAILELNSQQRLDFTETEKIGAEKPFLMIRTEPIDRLDLAAGSVDCLITSPPYLYAQEYFRSTKMDLYWLNLANDDLVRKLTRDEIGQRVKPIKNYSSDLEKLSSFQHLIAALSNNKSKNGKTNLLRVSAYFSDLFYFLDSSFHWLKPGGYLAIFVGEPKAFGIAVPIKDILIEMISHHGFKLEGLYFDLIKGRNLQAGRLNLNPDGIGGEWLILSQKN